MKRIYCCPCKQEWPKKELRKAEIVFRRTKFTPLAQSVKPQDVTKQAEQEA
ncbi:MAG: hypothetical protein Kow00107_05110 [Planctomycetota bacterium]